MEPGKIFPFHFPHLKLENYQCSQTCDGGTSTQSFTCRNEMGDEDILMCDPHKKPHNVIRCNDQPCPIWKVGDWSPACDSMCERHRQVRCMNNKSELFVLLLYLCNNKE